MRDQHPERAWGDGEVCGRVLDQLPVHVEGERGARPDMHMPHPVVLHGWVADEGAAAVAARHTEQVVPATPGTNPAPRRVRWLGHITAYVFGVRAERRRATRR